MRLRYIELGVSFVGPKMEFCTRFDAAVGGVAQTRVDSGSVPVSG